MWEILRTYLAVDVWLAIILIVFGAFSLAVIPRKPNWFMGYRTSLACKNQDTWVFAHKHFGKQMIIFGLIYTVLTFVRIILLDNDAATWVVGLIIAAQVVSVLLALIPTEPALRKEFDKDGIRRR